jgi:hypothetical protein
MAGLQNIQYLPHIVHKVMRDFYNRAQGKRQISQEYYDESNSMVLTATESGATIGAHPGAIADELNTSAIDPAHPTDMEQKSPSTDTLQSLSY